ncbi:WD40 repeat-like protein [Trametes sanguinea]|nr:WD40 repeat-like protein [Trametes sanguinea]
MSWDYTDCALLRHGHVSSITAIAICPTGTHIATGSLDGVVCIWELASQKVLYSYDGEIAILALRWDPRLHDTVLCGMDHGYLASLCFRHGKLHIQGFQGHAYPVDCIAVSGDLEALASGAQNELHVWNLKQAKPIAPWTLYGSLREPETHSQDVHLVVAVTSLHWTSCGSSLIATYLHHGARIYETKTWTCIQSITTDGQIARADLSFDDKSLVVSNALTGFDLYSLESGNLIRAFGHDMRARRATPVRFAETGQSIVGGTTIGEMLVWDVSSGRRMQSLPWEGS